VIENIQPGPLEAAAVTGASRLKVLSFALVPDVAPSMVSIGLFWWEFNVRASTVLGVVGAGGIGQELKNSMGLLDFPRLLTILALTLIMVTVIDQGRVASPAPQLAPLLSCAAPVIRVEGVVKATRTAGRPSAACPSRCGRGSSSRCSARAGQARRLCSGVSPASPGRMQARSSSMDGISAASPGARSGWRGATSRSSSSSSI
jgi:hypothetical protein